MKICRETLNSVKIGQKYLALDMNNTFYCCRRHKFATKAFLLLTVIRSSTIRTEHIVALPLHQRLREGATLRYTFFDYLILLCFIQYIPNRFQTTFVDEFIIFPCNKCYLAAGIA